MTNRLLMSFLLVLSLSACPAPNGTDANSGDSTTNTGDTSDNNNASTGGNFSKQAYIDLLNCLKTQQPASAAAIDQAIGAAQMLPDSAFDNADSPAFAVWAQQAKAVGCGT